MEMIWLYLLLFGDELLMEMIRIVTKRYNKQWMFLILQRSFVPLILLLCSYRFDYFLFFSRFPQANGQFDFFKKTL